MSPAIAAILTVATLVVWHLRTPRHPYWAVCRDARFYITIGYPAVAMRSLAGPSHYHHGLGMGDRHPMGTGCDRFVCLRIQCSPLRTRTAATHISGDRIN